ncbi:MAG: hypothetical protein JNN20_12360 [Betaproteobacteria bacterium]|nr:hypothetical protein [Betaproteobacteria bacterium]
MAAIRRVTTISAAIRRQDFLAELWVATISNTISATISAKRLPPMSKTAALTREATATVEVDTAAYGAVMKEIKYRFRVAEHFAKNPYFAIFEPTAIESAVLQIRMILELIALGSIAANKELFETNRMRFEKHWNPADIVKDVEKINPNFYPRPIIEVPSPTPGVTNDLKPITTGFLTRQELVSLHGRCGEVLHARNPYGKQRDSSWFRTQIPTWLERIRCLLNSHQIYLLGDEAFYLVHMQEDRDEEVHIYRFEKREPGIAPALPPVNT